VRDVGVKASTRFGSRFVRSISGETLKRVNKFLHVDNLFIKGVSAGTKAGSKAAVEAGKAGASAVGKTVAKTGAKAGSRTGIVNLSKMVPLLGGIVGGGLNIVFTRQMGLLAVRLLKDGPPDGGKSHSIEPSNALSDDEEHGAIIEGAANIVEDFVTDFAEEPNTEVAETGEQDAYGEGDRLIGK
jgi:hypothetical protein